MPQTTKPAAVWDVCSGLRGGRHAHVLTHAPTGTAPHKCASGARDLWGSESSRPGASGRCPAAPQEAESPGKAGRSEQHSPKSGQVPGGFCALTSRFLGKQIHPSAKPEGQEPLIGVITIGHSFLMVEFSDPPPPTRRCEPSCCHMSSVSPFLPVYTLGCTRRSWRDTKGTGTILTASVCRTRPGTQNEPRVQPRGPVSSSLKVMRESSVNGGPLTQPPTHLRHPGHLSQPWGQPCA